MRRGGRDFTFTNTVGNTAGLLRLTNAQHIVSLLSTPKIERLPNGRFQQTTVKAIVRSITGGAMEKSKNMRDFAFRYEVTSEVVPYARDWQTTNLTMQSAAQLGNQAMRNINLYQNLYDVRLTIRWPLLPKTGSYDVGRSRRTLRTLVSGELLPIYTNSAPYLYMFDPYTFISAH